MKTIVFNTFFTKSLSKYSLENTIEYPTILTIILLLRETINKKTYEKGSRPGTMFLNNFLSDIN